MTEMQPLGRVKRKKMEKETKMKEYQPEKGNVVARCRLQKGKKRREKRKREEGEKRGEKEKQKGKIIDVQPGRG